MSLDVYLEMPDAPKSTGSGIFVREDGQTKEITREEWDIRYPDREPVIAESLESSEVYSANITHNLGRMAGIAGIYEALWRPEEIGITHAEQLIPLLTDGLAQLNSNPKRFVPYSPANGWGTYDGLVRFVVEYLDACTRYPSAEVKVWR